jgi:hypothetical protein
MRLFPHSPATYALNNNQIHYAQRTSDGFKIRSATALGAGNYAWQYTFM